MPINNGVNGQFGGNNGHMPTATVQAGNPNTVVAGNSFAGLLGDYYFDTTGGILYICTTPGASGTAVWTSSSNSAAGFTWNNTTGTTQAMAVQNGYISSNAALSTFTLPATIAVTQRVAVQGAGAAGWIIAQNAGQTIHFGSATTTTGTGGSIASINQYDSLELICIVANTTFAVVRSQGNLTYV